MIPWKHDCEVAIQKVKGRLPFAVRNNKPLDRNDGYMEHHCFDEDVPDPADDLILVQVLGLLVWQPTRLFG